MLILGSKVEVEKKTGLFETIDGWVSVIQLVSNSKNTIISTRLFFFLFTSFVFIPSTIIQCNDCRP